MRFADSRRRSFFDKRIMWWIALICAVFGILSGLHLIIVPALTAYVYWIVVGALVLLLVATR
jgi:uncharacterized membrane protein HdeD (DUF308 family)